LDWANNFFLQQGACLTWKSHPDQEFIVNVDVPKTNYNGQKGLIQSIASSVLLWANFCNFAIFFSRNQKKNMKILWILRGFLPFFEIKIIKLATSRHR